MELQKYPSLKLEDLKLGMKVRMNQLDKIINTYILLLDTEEIYDEDLITVMEGTIVFFGAEKTEDFYNLYKQYDNSSLLLVINREEEIV